MSLPVSARAIRIASIVASEPEFTNRQRSSPKRPARFSATATVSSVTAAKWVPSGARARSASTISGLAWPWTIDPKPLWKSQ